MVSISDLVLEITEQIRTAKVALDIKSKQIAESYSNDPVLKYFPCPKMSIDEVKIDIVGCVITKKLSPNVKIKNGYIDTIISTLDMPMSSSLQSSIKESISSFIMESDDFSQLINMIYEILKQDEQFKDSETINNGIEKFKDNFFKGMDKKINLSTDLLLDVNTDKVQELLTVTPEMANNLFRIKLRIIDDSEEIEIHASGEE